MKGKFNKRSIKSTMFRIVIQKKKKNSIVSLELFQLEKHTDDEKLISIAGDHAICLRTKFILYITSWKSNL